MSARLFQVALIIAVVIVPLWVQLHVQPTPDEIGFLKAVWPNEIDLFTWWKSRWLCLAGLIALFGVVYDEKRRASPLFSRPVLLGLAGFASLTIASTLLSSHRQLAIFGFPTYREGALTQFAYLSLFWAASNYCFSANTLVPLKITLIFTTLGVSLVGALQLFGENPYRHFPLTHLVFGGEEIARQFEPQGSAVFSTLMNANHVGSFFSIIIPFFCVLFLHETTRLRTIALGALIFAVAPVGLANMGRASYLGIVAGIIPATWIAQSNVRGRVIYLILVMIGWSMGLKLQGISVPERVASMGREVTRVLGDARTQRWRHFSVENGVARMVFDGADLVIGHGQGNVTLTRLNGQPVRIMDKGAWYKIIEPGYGDYELHRDTSSFGQLLRVAAGGQNLQLASTATGMKVFVWNSLFDSQHAPRSRLIPDFIASLRGYIWSRTIPILSRCLWLGKGHGTFALYFPQRDFLGKLSIGWPSHMVTDRPHNFYFQTIHATGVLSLICIAVVLISFLRTAFRVLRGVGSPLSDRMKVLSASFSAVIGYLVTALCNDSSVGVAPVFWTLLGVGWGLARYERSFE